MMLICIESLKFPDKSLVGYLISSFFFTYKANLPIVGSSPTTYSRMCSQADKAADY